MVVKTSYGVTGFWMVSKDRGQLYWLETMDMIGPCFTVRGQWVKGGERENKGLMVGLE